jgi:hypothetical protein
MRPFGGQLNRGDRTNRRPRRGELSPLGVVLLVVGVLFLVVALVCGGILWIGYRKAQNLRQEMISREQAEADRRFAEAERARPDPVFNPVRNLPADKVPPPKPGFETAGEPPPQPKPTMFATDDIGHPDRWRVLFRSRKPELWNTNTQAGDDFAIPIQSAPADTRFLRLRRMDTGDALIISMARTRIGGADPANGRARWNGEGKDEYTGYHLGIAEGPVARFNEGRGTVGVLIDGWDANPGSGFGHAHHIENGGQRYSWRGKEIRPTAFEIAVTTDKLTEPEMDWFRD